MNTKPKTASKALMFLAISISIFALMACDTAIGRAIGIDGDGGEIEVPSAPEVGVVYTVSGELGSPAPDEDEWTFEGPEGAMVEIHMVSSPGSPGVDTFLVLNGPNGQQVGMNDDYEGFHAGLIISLPYEGQYTVIAKGYGQAVGLYDLTVKFRNLDGATPVDSDGGPIAEVAAGSVSSSYGEIQMMNDEDVWEITALTGDNLLIVLDGITRLDPTLTLIDPDGVQVAYNDDFVGRDSQITFIAESDGVYLAVAKGYGGRSIGDYNLNVSGNSERAIFNDITENLERAESDLVAANELAAAAIVTELVENAEVAEAQAAAELVEVEQAAVVAEEAERNSAQADVALNSAEQAEAEAEEVLEELNEASDQLDELVVQDISQLEQVTSEADIADEANRVAEQQEAEAEAELSRLREEQAESARIAAATEARLEAERERQETEAAVEVARLEEARTLERLARNAEAAARAETESEAARVELALREEAAAQAELAALAASIAEQAAEQELAEESQEASQAEVVATAAAEAARSAAGDSALTTIIEGRYVGVSSPQYGSASVVGGEIYYTHDGSSNPVDTFTATVRGTNGEFFDVTMSVELTYVRPNNAPVAVDDIISIPSGVMPDDFNQILDALGNDTDADGDNLTITHINGIPVEEGRAGGGSWGAFEYADLRISIFDEVQTGIDIDGIFIGSNHPTNYSGQEAFTYTVSDGNGLSSVGTVYVNLTTDYELPVASDRSIQIQQSATSEYDLHLRPSTRIESVTQGVRGVVEISGDNTIAYAHNGDEADRDTFEYTVVDDFGATTSGTVHVSVIIPNRNPTPPNVSAIVDEGGAVHIPIIGPSSGFSPDQLDPEADPVRLAADDSLFHSDTTATHPSNGTYTVSNIIDGETGNITESFLVYTHDGSETSQDQFNYELRQEDGGTGWGTVTIIIAPVNDAPFAVNYNLNVAQGGSVDLNVVNSETDPDGPVLSVAISAEPHRGSLVLDGSTFTYTHNGNDPIADYFHYTLDDGIGHAVSGIVHLNVAIASLDVSAVALPSAGLDKVSWDPEIGIRISSSDNLGVRNIADAISLFECADSLCYDTQLTQVDGETTQLAETSSQILSFIPDVPLYGGTTYKVSVNPNSGIELADGNIQVLSGLIEDVSSWTFTTAEMTRFTLPLLITYSDSECRGEQEPLLAHRIGERLCLTLEDIDNLLYGMEEDTPGHYFDDLSSGKFAISPIRDRAGHVVKSVQIDRNKPYIGGNCGRHWEKEALRAWDTCPDYAEDTTIREEMDQIFDRLRYRNIGHKDGSYNLLAPYLPDRDWLIGNYDMGSEQDRTGDWHHYFRNVTPIYVWGVGGPDTSPWSTIGMASPPKGSQQTALDVSHEEALRTWGHELGHAYFGLPDYYSRGEPAGPNKTGPLDIMGDRDGGGSGKIWPPFTAWSMLKAEFEEPEEPLTDAQLLGYIANVDDTFDLNGITGVLNSRGNANGFNIIKVPAIIERDTQEVKGHYLLELYGSTGYDSQIYVNSDSVNFGDNPGAFPGGIAIWKWDKTEQKVQTDVCGQYFGDRVPHCGADFLFQNGNHMDPIEYYPSIPSITRGNGSAWPGTSPGINTLFPWWYSAQLPYGSDYDAELTNMPTTIELPVLEIAPFGENPNFGGGNRVATITLSFDEFINDIKTKVRDDSQSANSGNLNGYTLSDAATFTVNVQKHETPEYMTYRDHVREGQIQFAQPGAMWDEMQTYGFYRFTE
ncbi:MAG: Cadherin-like [Chloroflexi bacterium]|nr:MAG: Cadherin-like [Chloroflexota bacterium]